MGEGRTGEKDPQPGQGPDRALRDGSQPSSDAAPSVMPALPALALAKGGGAIRGIGEKLSTNAATGTFSLALPVATPPGRGGAALQLSVSYTSGSGNGPFGIGWHCSVPAIARKVDRGMPLYADGDESDVFVLSGSEDLVPVRSPAIPPRDGYRIMRYRPRVEGSFARIERWTNEATGDIHWRVTTRDNVLSLYGRSEDARIADPGSPDHRVFTWLLEETRDDRGNVARFSYKPEDGAGVDPARPSEHNRFERPEGGPIRFLATAQRYLKRVQYGNRLPVAAGEAAPDDPTAWHFEVVLDYGEHDAAAPSPDGEPNAWLLRRDPFSNHRAGFEIRTYRLCRRVLVFHRFPELGSDPCLVRSTDFTYEESPVITYLTAAQQAGYSRKQGAPGYTRAPMPAVALDYQRLGALQDTARALDGASLDGLPSGVDGATARWVDLDGEGVQGVLRAADRGWYYKANLGEGRLAPPELLRSLPVPAELAGGVQQLVDIQGDGRLDLVSYAPSRPGFFARTDDGGWQSFRPLREVPRIDWNDPNLRFLDVDGDGLPDVLVTEHDAFVWYRSLAEEGVGPAQRASKPWDEEKGAAVIFADGTETILLADMSGDGLVDLVRVRSGEVCYWPNQGYGRFGRKITLDRSPVFDHPDQFDPKRVRFADVDGSGTADIVYLGREGASIYLNQSGNGLSEPQEIRSLPPADTMSGVAVLDLLGTGTSCLVWSSAAPGGAGRRVSYVDLAGGEKPHLLTSVKNNLGAETRVTYAPSTRFYLADKAAGERWITRLPFPVQVVERITTYDRISRSRFDTRYTYHHGYFDGVEREFQGFARVEQFDTEELGALTASGDLPAGDNVDAASYVPPMRTKIWFHTGAFFEGDLISKKLEEEYYQEPGLSDAQRRAMLLDDTVLPPGLAPADAREACRALKGSMLRQETYALDGTSAADRPYSVSESNQEVVRVQARGEERHGVFFVHPRETVDLHYERALYDGLPDPRVTHAFTLAVDPYGNVLRTAAVAYGRRYDGQDPVLTAADKDRQKHIWITWTENAVTNAVELDDALRAPVPYERRTYEVTKLSPASSLPGITNLFRFDEMAGAIDGLVDGAHDLAVEDVGGAGATQAHAYRRLLQHERTLFRSDDLTGPLPLGTLQPRGLPHETYKLAFTPGLLTALYEDRVTDPMLANEGRFVHSEGDSSWWVPSGRVLYSPDDGDTPAQELAHALSHFFLPYRFVSPFGATTTVTYDSHDFLVLQTRDQLGNAITAGARDAAGAIVENGNDYRVLQAAKLMDANRNRSAVAFDALGEVVGTAVMGKPEESLGDSLDGFEPDLPDSAVADHLASPLADPQAILGRATSRLVYDLFAYARTASDPAPQAAVVYTLSRETHDADLAPNQKTRVQHAFAYSDGFGRSLQQKIQAEPGPLTPGGPDVDPRWVGTGWTTFDNKGKPVRKYEPFFSDTHRPELGAIHGVSSILFYDPPGRVVATLHPNHTYEKVVFDPWQQASFDVNDTVLHADPKLDPDAGGFFRRLPDGEYLPTWHERRRTGALGAEEQSAADKAALHAETPTLIHFDTLGRAFLAVKHNKYAKNGGVTEEKYASRTTLDVEGRTREVEDALGRIVARYGYDMVGGRAHEQSMEAGERRAFRDVGGMPLRGWDSRDHVTFTEYDDLRRPLRVFVVGADPDHPAQKLLCETIEYGEGQPGDVALNLRARVFRKSDGAGVLTMMGGASPEAYDFKGNPLRTRRQLAAEFRKALDWSNAVPLEGEAFDTVMRYDALNRPTELTTPDQSRLVPSYNEAGLLESVAGNVRGSAATTTFVKDVDYDVKGRRTSIRYGNDAVTEHTYDPETFRLVRLVTTRAGTAGALVDTTYTFDPAGNITHVRDAAQESIYFANAVVEPAWEYTYDAVYRLFDATGREHLGMVGGAPEPTSDTDAPRVGLTHPNDRSAMGIYEERYEYDAADNLRVLAHRGTSPGAPGWTRTYTHQEASQIEPAKKSNRLTSTTTSGDPTLFYTHDAHGNLITMPHLKVMRWDHRDRLQATSKQDVQNGGTPELTYYVYDSSGQRVRKVTERQAAPGQTPARKNERLYLGGFEIYREYDGKGTLTLERETLFVKDDKAMVALVETRTKGNDDLDGALVRYPMGNHLGSITLELDGGPSAEILSYEEYYPYGGTAYQGAATKSGAAKRYRHTAKERDDESGLYYHGARYYAPWLGRWTAADPAGIDYGLDLYVYCRNNPLMFSDPEGTDPRLTVDQQNSSITYSTTVHVFATGEELERLRATGDRATAFFRDSSGTARVNGRDWTVQYDVTFQYHDTATEPLPSGISRIHEQQEPAVPPHAPTYRDQVGQAPGLSSFYSETLMRGFRAATQQIAGFQPGDTVLSMVNVEGGAGVTRAVLNPDALTRTPRAIIGVDPADTQSDDAMYQVMIHEIGHTLGFDERYDDHRQNAPHPGYEDDFMSSVNEARDPTMAQGHREASARFAAFVADGRNLQGAVITGIQVDSTAAGAVYETNHRAYDVEQTQLRGVLWTQVRDELAPPTTPTFERVPGQAAARVNISEPWGSIFAVLAALAAVAIGIGIFFGTRH
jgi:RHS repeat-associated protein